MDPVSVTQGTLQACQPPLQIQEEKASKEQSNALCLPRSISLMTPGIWLSKSFVPPTGDQAHPPLWIPVQATKPPAVQELETGRPLW